VRLASGGAAGRPNIFEKYIRKGGESWPAGQDLIGYANIFEYIRPTGLSRPARSKPHIDDLNRTPRWSLSRATLEGARGTLPKDLLS